MSAYPIEEIMKNANYLKIDIIYIDVDIPISDKKRIPNHFGVYILKNEFGERYIGSSIDILNRQKYHHIKNVDTIDVFLTEGDVWALHLERRLIHELNPELNRGCGISRHIPKKRMVLPGKIYSILEKKQIELCAKYGKMIQISDIANAAILRGIDNIEKVHGFSIELFDIIVYNPAYYFNSKIINNEWETEIQNKLVDYQQ